MRKSLDEIRRDIYAPPPVTLKQKLADFLAQGHDYVVITKGTRQQFELDAEELMTFIAEHFGKHGLPDPFLALGESDG